VSAPLVSILVPTYNGERFLRLALRSALDQSYRDIEVIIGDDASTDGTADVLASVAAADARVRVVRHDTNVGATRTPSGCCRRPAASTSSSCCTTTSSPPTASGTWCGAWRRTPAPRWPSRGGC
jgi:cellulose synthase/poly-beta-1,6-N-acetylglucosamine synthase-like glycosyltransferase